MGIRQIGMLAALAASLAPVAVAGAEPPLPSEFFGMNLNRVFYDDPSPTHQLALAAARLSGVESGRFDLTWSIVEPNPPKGGVHKFEWDVMDARVAALASAHIRPNPILCYCAFWAARVWSDKVPPADDADFVNYAVQVARRYGPGGYFWQARQDLPYLPIHRWEIWNEENLPEAFWRTGRDADAYGQLYIAAHDAIHAVDPRARVIVGGLAGGDSTYVAEMLDAHPDLAAHLDGVAIHPYGRTVSDVLARVRRFRARLDEILGPDVPIEITEVGWYTSGSGPFLASDRIRAGSLSLLTDALARSNCLIDAYEPYTWLTAERNPDNLEDWYGIWSASRHPLDSVSAWAAAVRRYAGPMARRRARTGRQLLPVCGRAWTGAPQLRLAVHSRHARDDARNTSILLTVTYLGRPVEGAAVVVRAPLQSVYRRTTDGRGHVRLPLITGTHVAAHVGQVARSRAQTVS